jgi:hypothetical protein
VEVTIEGALSSNASEGLMTGLMKGLIILMTGDENECRRKKQVMLLR